MKKGYKKLEKLVKEMESSPDFIAHRAIADEKTEAIKNLFDGHNMGFIMVVMASTVAELICEMADSEEMARSGNAFIDSIIGNYINIYEAEGHWDGDGHTIQ